MLGTEYLESDQNLNDTITRLQRLVELSATLNSTLNLDDLLRLIIQTASEVLDCEAASILLYDEAKQSLFFAAATGENASKLAEIPVPLKGSLAGTIFRTKQPLILHNIKNDSRHNLEASAHVGFQPRSLLGVPLRIRDKTIGVLESLNKINGRFTETDKNLLIAVASHAAVTIHNAQLLKALQKSYEDVSKADTLKRNFLALASHELRTPLGIIIGYSTFLQDESDGESSDHAEQVLNAALKMRTLLDDMNNLTMLENETSSFISRKASLQNILEKASEEVYEFAQAKKQKIVFDFPKEPLETMVDTKKLRGALVNLLHNALRFSPEKEEIILGLKKKNDKILFWVKDNGIGIAKDELENIFEKFYQIESPNIRRHGGMGLGLTIAQGLVEAQGGKLWAESEGKGMGSTFKISLPFRQGF